MSPALERMLNELSSSHRTVERLLRDRNRWLRVKEISWEVDLGVNRIYQILRRLEIIGLVDVRLVGGGFCEYRHAETIEQDAA